MKSLTGKIMIAVMSLFLIAYAGYQAWQFFYDPYKTEIAMRYTVSETVHVQGLAVRTEELLFGESTGSVSYVLEDAARVLKNMDVAFTHASPDTVENRRRADELEREIDLLKEANATLNQGYGTSDLLNQQIGDSLAAMAQSSEEDTLAGLPACREKLLLLLNKKQILIGEESNYDSRIAELSDQRTFLLDRILADSEQSVKASTTGYFISSVDGFEELVNRETLKEMSVEQIEGLIDGEAGKKGEAIGKIADSYIWNYVISVEPADAEKFSPGQSVTAVFDGMDEAAVELTVSDIMTDESSKNSVVVFECEVFTSELASLRQTGADLLITSFSGIRVSSEAIRFNSEQQRGVYVLDRGTVKFKTVDILYEGVGYKLCRWQQGTAGTLQVFDEVFVRGADLYDGKAVE